MRSYRKVDSRYQIRRFLRQWPPPKCEDCDRATQRHAEKECAQTEARELQKVLPRSNICVHSLCEYKQEAAYPAQGDKCRPVHFAVEILEFTLPRGVPDCRSYRRSTTKRTNNNNPSMSQRLVSESITAEA
jgi:hypothetical protein